MIRWWPSIGLAAMLLLGWAVGDSSTPVDKWFQQFNTSPLRWLAVFADPRLLVGTLVAVAVVALWQRRWRLAAMVVVAPAVGLVFVRVLKQIFYRQKGDGGLAYPSGHITTTTIVMGLVIMVAGAAWWAVAIAVGAVALAMLGVGTTYHYFTDVVGGLLLGSALVCAAAVIARRDLTRVNPRAIYVTRRG
ncbi:phosphoesterase PA-phosphatase [Mycobacterium sp. IDR2000157661]|uniref:phosphoesterase PA-phosphatase n=1 Tax=Mycobacterium sp. IDR2000157661 TaxID=2867005 RepID=UPI001EE9F4B6|nr:phosphoesterase PA-phosphatase [Mycobacterium sp. IDR2000157661]ULE34243.1 phosphoesterase PA-phosphatase [Mycobacterium sp. IDR2000157661]